jgi:ribulose 1,5-bisphosphate carboxylase large subunit-like protein
LIGVLAGDLFNFSAPVPNPPNVTIKKVSLPESMRTDALSSFRDGTAYTITEIREAFKLQEGYPLLAFSLKPRTNLKFDILRNVALDVLKAGFHIVELDTRNLNLQPDDITQLLELANQAAEVGTKHVTRFSPNLSIPSHLVVDIAEKFFDVQEDPVVMKIDGGLDGISSCQAIREAFSKKTIASRYHKPGRSPIITCYPLLRRQLKDRISNNLFVDALTLSGADIIYPGGRPTVSPECGTRTLDAAESGRLINSVNSYHEMIERNCPMPTIAGGVHAGELHAFYELLGPNTAFFLGGAISLHKNGPAEGAKLCVQIIENAIELREKAGQQELNEDLNDGLIERIEETGYENKYPYISPVELVKTVSGLTGWFIKKS